MKWYKKIGLLATTGLALFGLGACSNDGKSADGTVTIEYFNQKKEMTKTLEEIARDFEKENPKVKVKVVNVPNAGEVLKTRVLAGDVPDVVNIYPQSIELQEWAKAGVFEDLSNKDYLKRVKNGYAEKYAVNGKVYNVPFTANAYGIYYNKDKFEELGLKVPETWDEFEQLVKDIVAKGQMSYRLPDTASPVHMPTLQYIRISYILQELRSAARSAPSARGESYILKCTDSGLSARSA